MGRRIPRWNQKKLDERMAQGFGCGWGPDYKAWLQLGDVSSRGVTSRFWSPKAQRVLTFFSNVEKCAFLVAESLAPFKAYHEQGPMDRELTLDICRSYGIKHPRYFGTRIPAVLTFDGLLFSHGSRPQLIDCKHSSAEITGRLQEHYAIRHEYARRLDYGIVHITEQSYPWQLIHNLQWIRMSALQREHMRLPEREIEVGSTRIFDQLARAVEDKSGQPLREFLRSACTSNGMAAQFGVFALRRLLWEHHVGFDMTVHFHALLHGPVRALHVHPRMVLATPAFA
jgi:hypothetical protein